MKQALITRNAKMSADNLIVGIEDTSLRKKLFVYANIAESLVDFFENIGFSATTKPSLFKNTSISAKFDIADIFIENIRADIRITDDETAGILIPKQHKELGIEPDIYIVASIDDELKSYEVQGFIPTEQLNFDKEIQDYYILSPKKLLPIDRFKTLSGSIKIKKYKPKLSEQDILQLFLKNEEEDISLNHQKALLHSLLANGEFVQKINTLNKFDAQAKAIKNFPQLLEEIKPTVEEELSDTVQEVEIDENTKFSEVIDELDTYQDVIEELHPQPKEEIIDETKELPQKKKPLILHVISIILIGIILVITGINGHKEKPQPQKTDKKTTPIIHNAIIPNEEIKVTKISWGISSELAQNKEIITYLNEIGIQVKNILTSEFTSLNEFPTQKTATAAIILDNTGNYITSSIKETSGSKQIDEIILKSVENTIKSTPSKNIRTSAPFIRTILLIKL